MDRVKNGECVCKECVCEWSWNGIVSVDDIWVSQRKTVRDEGRVVVDCLALEWLATNIKVCACLLLAPSMGDYER